MMRPSHKQKFTNLVSSFKTSATTRISEEDTKKKLTLLPRALYIRDLRIDSSADEDLLLVGQENRRIGFVIAVDVAALYLRAHFFRLGFM